MTEFFHNCTTNERKKEIGKFDLAHKELEIDPSNLLKNKKCHKTARNIYFIRKGFRLELFKAMKECWE